MEMMIQEDFTAFNGDPQKALDIALQTLLPLGFQVLEHGDTFLTVSGPGFNSTRQNPLLGISRAEFNFDRSSLQVRAELGGLDRFQRIMLIVMMGVGLFDALLLLALWYFIEDLHAKTWFLGVPVLVFLPWVFIAPFMTRWIIRRTKEALNSLLHTMATRA